MFEDVLIESAQHEGRSAEGPVASRSRSLLHVLVIGVALGRLDLVRRGRAGAADPGDLLCGGAAAASAAAGRRPEGRGAEARSAQKPVPGQADRDDRSRWSSPRTFPQPLAAPEPEAPTPKASRGASRAASRAACPGGVLGGVVGGTGPGDRRGAPPGRRRRQGAAC